MRKKAQSILEYIVLLGIVAAALTAMQLYFQRGIQAAVKLAADEMGSQREGAAEIDYKYNWKRTDLSKIKTTSVGTKSSQLMKEGAVTYGRNETTAQEGVLSWDIQEKK